MQLSVDALGGHGPLGMSTLVWVHVALLALCMIGTAVMAYCWFQTLTNVLPEEEAKGLEAILFPSWFSPLLLTEEGLRWRRRALLCLVFPFGGIAVLLSLWNLLFPFAGPAT